MKKPLFILLLMCALPIQAGLYQCIGNDGTLEFRDKPCTTTSEDQTFMPVKYKKTEVKVLQQEEKKLKKSLKEQDKEERRETRIKLKNQKLQEKSIAKAKREEARCLRIKEKIKAIEDRLRFGYSSKRCNSLRRQLEEQLTLEQRYCK
jgi:hypothetical protein